MVIERIFSALMRVSGLGSCRQVQELCYEFVEEDIGPGKEKRIRRHLKICKPCLRFISSYIAIRALGKTVPPETISDQQKDQLIEHLLHP